MDLDVALQFARTTTRAVLTTVRGDGRPQLSNVLYAVAADGRLLVSTTAARAKYRNISRDPWTAVHATSEDFFAYVVLEGTAELAPVIDADDAAGVAEHVALYRAVVGEHPDWADFRASLVRERRCIIRFTPTRAYGMLQLPG